MFLLVVALVLAGPPEPPAFLNINPHRGDTWNLHAIRPDGTGERQLTFPGAVAGRPDDLRERGVAALSPGWRSAVPER